MMDIIQDNVGGALGGAISVIIGAAVWFKRMKPTFARDDVSIAAANADLTVIDRMTKEIDRLSLQNTSLAESLNRLQLETVKIATENSKLHMEIQALREENGELRNENKEMRKEREELLNEMVELKSDMKEMSNVIKDLLAKKS